MVTTKTKETSEERPSLGSTWKEVVRKQKSLLAAMVVLAVMSAISFCFAMTTLRPQNTVVIVGYGDVYGDLAGISGGYRRDSWANMLAYPILALVFGILHNVLVLRIYRKYGKGLAMTVAVGTMFLVAGAFLVLFRLLGEW